VIDAPSQAVLADAFRKTSRSLLQYVRDSFPWTTPGHDGSLKRLFEIACEEEEACGRLGRFFTRHHMTVPYPGSYPSSFTTINFIELGHLQKLLVEYQRQAVTDLQAKLPSAQDSEARSLLQGLLELKRRHLTALEKLDAPAEAAPQAVEHHH